MPLLPDTDRTYDWAVHGRMGTDMEKSKAEFRAETQENAGIHERDAAERIQGRNKEEDTDTVYIKTGRERGRWRGR